MPDSDSKSSHTHGHRHSNYGEYVRCLRRRVRAKLVGTDGQVFSVTNPHNSTPCSPDEHPSSNTAIPKHSARNKFEKDDTCISPQEYDSASSNSCLLTDGRYYMNLLSTTQDAVLQCHEKIAVVTNYNGSSQKLHSSSYSVIVKIFSKMICSCDSRQRYYLSSLLDNVMESQCIHCQALRKTNCFDDLSEWNDKADHQYESQAVNLQENVIRVSEHCVIVYVAELACFKTVCISGNRLKCDCSNHTGCCKYIAEAAKTLRSSDCPESLLSFKELLEQPLVCTTVEQQVALSWKKIEFVDSREYCNLQNSELPVKECKNCTMFSLSDESKREIICFLADSTVSVNVTTGVCVSCKNSAVPDCGDFGFLNMGTYLICHRLLRDYLKLFVNDGLTLYSYYKKIYWSSLEHNIPTTNIISYHQLRLAWHEFCKLLNYDYFECPVCGNNPNIVICDGMALGFRRCFRLVEEPETEDNEALPTLLEGCSYSDTLVLGTKSVRTTLQHVLHTGNEESYVKLRKECETSATYLLPVLNAYSDTAMPDYWIAFLKEIAKDSPATGLAQCDATRLSEILGGSMTCDELIALDNMSPVIGSLMKSCNEHDKQLAMPIMEHIIDRVKFIQNKPSHQLALQNEDDSSGYFPYLPVYSTRGIYKMDRMKSSKASCNKYSKQHRTLLPGIFTVHCQHGVCYGFQVMDGFESPNTAFSVIRTRFQTAPQVIVYDNACNLHRYCLNRDPGFFSSTRFLVDRFHWNNHTACSASYNLSSYPEYNYINSQVAEQRNSTLIRLKASLSYMAQDNFFRCLSVFLGFRNVMNILKLRKPVNESEKCLMLLSKLYG